MFGLNSRLLHAQEASSPQAHVEDEQVKAGREAENRLVERLKTEGQVPEGDLFCKLRIPDNFQTRRHEIDIVVVTAYGVYVLEVKNWSGEVRPNKKGDCWIQKKRAHNGENGTSVAYDVQHSSAVDCIKAKANLLRNHLMKNGCCLKERFFHPRLVFMNDRVQLDESISAVPEVIVPEALPYFVQYFQWSLLGKMTSSIVPAIISGQLSYALMESARAILKRTGTWDVVILHGGKSLEGDFKGCAHFAPNRRETELLQFSHQRSPAVGKTWAVLGYSPQATVTMYCRGGAGWLWHASHGTVNIPYSAEVIFRVAGEDSDSKIPANEVDQILLSV